MVKSPIEATLARVERARALLARAAPATEEVARQELKKLAEQLEAEDPWSVVDVARTAHEQLARVTAPRRCRHLLFALRLFRTWPSEAADTVRPLLADEHPLVRAEAAQTLVLIDEDPLREGWGRAASDGEREGLLEAQRDRLQWLKFRARELPDWAGGSDEYVEAPPACDEVPLWLNRFTTSFEAMESLAGSVISIAGILADALRHENDLIAETAVDVLHEAQEVLPETLREGVMKSRQGRLESSTPNAEWRELNVWLATLLINGRSAIDYPPADLVFEEPSVLRRRVTRPRLERSVEDLELSVRARIILRRAGITTVGELCDRSADDLMELRNCGFGAVHNIRERLAGWGLRLRDE